MGESAGSAMRLPQAYCVFCTTTTPHVHERLAVDGRQIARSVCFTCKAERPKEWPESQVRSESVR